ncbi:hypothetical protein BA896_018705 [Janthinobacterium lividum]|uniref:Uncharacterized protein n=1 Tax=Janthinobacterium lividum TaxID=29581 RepID=A0A1E8PLM4_9BURK|nr:hypothetical protein BA896_018705 [Janthinobacterium lividum]
MAVRILSNALKASDVAAVHAGYAKWRKALLEAGVLLYESRRSWEAGEARAAGPPRQLRIEPACEDLCRRRAAHLCRLLQF